MARAATGRWIDITMEFGSPAGTWPGDAPFRKAWTSRLGDGKMGINLTVFSSSPHNGTHSDAPLHVTDRGAASESLDPEAYLGDCVVVDATKGADTIPATALPTKMSQERVLFKTRVGPPLDAFPPRFKGFSIELAEEIVKRKLRLVGTDAPSVDRADLNGLRAHKILFDGDVTFLENLDLSRAEPGAYELVALPLKVSGLCAAPVRALLRPK